MNDPSASRPPLDLDLQLDLGVKDFVETLYEHGVETYESCEGGVGHAFPVPTVCFHGDRGEGYRALAIALQHKFPVDELRRFWRVLDGELEGPKWEITFYKRSSPGGCKCQTCGR